ncbi:hypothetical protein GALMADRAFT_205867 [Galerina marginata CBS 339.88]|uniref:Uncharacterized protein n=1 Tax=Galerina marginata (strain CBS 339.88) TaxID=685588 RepID=A0A067TW05_GALM3|nr:hypothetical protein GALMADRAFT_205867 [Galerina marginata CBS 339.88]
MGFRQCRGSLCESFNFNDYDPKDCRSFSTGNCCPPCEELARVDEEVARAYDLLANLAKHRQAIKERINIHHDTLIQILPVEVASRIFITYVDDINAELDLEEEGIVMKRIVHPPFVLAAVCKDWRDIVTSTPQIWSTANIHIGRNVIPEVELTIQWITRSGRLPLNISLSLWSVPNPDSLSPLFQAIREQAPRWRRLSLRLPSNFYPIFIKDITRAPFLEYLQLYHPRFHGGGFHLPNTPLLSRLHLSDTPLANLTLQWDNLTDLQAQDTFVNEILEIFRRAQQLVTCKLEILEGFAHEELYPVPAAPIVHLSLKDFEVGLQRCDGLVDLELLLDKLVLPSLDRFVYHSGGHGPEPNTADHFISFFTRSQCLLTTLVMKVGGKDEILVLRILEHLPTVRTLSISGNNSSVHILTDGFWKRLSGDISTRNEEFLPRLESLQFRGRRSFSWIYFLQTIESLWGQNLNPIGTTEGSRRSGNITIDMDLSPYGHHSNIEYTSVDALQTLMAIKQNKRVSLKISTGIRRSE